MRGNDEFRVFRNTHLMGTIGLFNLVIRESNYQSVFDFSGEGADREPIARRIARRLRPWFWPRIDDAIGWVRAVEGSRWSPSIYLENRPRPLLQRLLDTSSPTESVLDLGCNNGSILNMLRENGYTKLYGVDAGRAALQMFSDRYPETFGVTEVSQDLFQRYLSKSSDQSFDIVHSNGATIELVHPSYPVVSELCRVTRSRIYVLIYERGHGYPRNYIQQFESRGFRLTYCERPIDLVNGASLLQFGRIVDR